MCWVRLPAMPGPGRISIQSCLTARRIQLISRSVLDPHPCHSTRSLTFAIQLSLTGKQHQIISSPLRSSQAQSNARIRLQVAASAQRGVGGQRFLGSSILNCDPSSPPVAFGSGSISNRICAICSRRYTCVLSGRKRRANIASYTARPPSI